MISTSSLSFSGSSATAPASAIGRVVNKEDAEDDDNDGDDDDDGGADDDGDANEEKNI